MRPVAPRTGAEERTFAEDQEEYLPVTVAIYPDFLGEGTRGLLWRYTLTPEERQRVAAGEDIYIMHLNFNEPLTPQQASVGPMPEWIVK